MANPENKQTNQNEPTQKKQNNVTEFNSQSTKGSTSPAGGPSSTTGAQKTGGSAGMTGGATGSKTGTTPTGSSTGNLAGGGSTGTSSTGTSTGAATATARSFIDQAKETAGQAYEAVTDKAATKLDEQKSTLKSGLATVADSVRQVSQNLGSSKTDSGLAEAAAKYTDTAARKLENVAGYFERKNVRDMARDLEGFARRNPAVFFGAAFGLGILAARFLKSTSPNYDSAARGREFAAAADTSHQLPAADTARTSPDFTAKPL
jgi:hypothetical protein